MDAATQPVDLRRIHSNSNGYVVKLTEPNSYDWLYVLLDAEEYVVKGCLPKRRSITLRHEHRIGAVAESG
jgi:hypothetical protein